MPGHYFPQPFFVKLALCCLCTSMPNPICADWQCFPKFTLFGSMLCDMWSKLKVNRELCYFFFKAWNVLPCVSPMISPSFQSSSSLISLSLSNDIIPIFTECRTLFCVNCIANTEENIQVKQLNGIGTWFPKEGHTWQHYYDHVFLRFQGILYSGWVCSKCSDGMGSKFWFWNTSEKV